jgi:NAD(P)-dependent dehydrogenase (short-subunit alcohol dehydrogenase family)
VKDKICVITGGTDGIGKEAAYGLAIRGAKVLVHGRDPDKGAQAVAELKARSANPGIEFLQADFGSLADVRRLAAAVMERAPRIDVLVNNAGGIFGSRRLSKDGYEMTLAVNHLAPFLLTHLLVDALKRGAPSRIVTTASRAHRSAKIAFDDLQSAQKYSAMGAYGRSKLANILFTRVLAKRLEGTDVTATCLHPGFVRTSIGRGLDVPLLLKPVLALIWRLARPPAKGAETVVHLAASPAVQGASGGYYVDCKLTPPSPAGQDDSAAERLWHVSEELVGIA